MNELEEKAIKLVNTCFGFNPFKNTVTTTITTTLTLPSGVSINR